MKKLTFAIISMVLLSACSLSPEEVALKNKELEIYAAAIAKPTIICTSGCEYTDPRRNISLAKETNGWDFANTLVKTTANVAMSAVPYAALGVVAVEGIKNSGGNTQNTDSYNSRSEANQANQQETVSGIKAGNDVDQSQQNQNNPVNNESTTNTDNNSVNDSNNSNDDNSSSDDNSTSENIEAPEVVVP